MRLRHVLVVMSALGAGGALLMALDYYRRLKDAERQMFIDNTTPGPDSILNTGIAHVAGLIALGIIFLALLLVLLSALKDPRFRVAVETGAVPTAETVEDAETAEGPRKDADAQRSEETERMETRRSKSSGRRTATRALKTATICDGGNGMGLPFKSGDRILFQGDSITDCGCRNPDNVNPLGNGYVAMLRGMLAAKHPGLKLTILNRGVSGDRTAELLKRWDEDTLALKPDWLSLKIGVNDVWRKRREADGGQQYIPLDEYTRNVRALIERSRAGGIRNFILISPTTIDDDPESELNLLLAQYDAAVREIAAEEKAIYVGVRERLWRAIREVPAVRWTLEGCHPTIIGHALIASVWLETLERAGQADG